MTTSPVFSSNKPSWRVVHGLTFQNLKSAAVTNRLAFFAHIEFPFSKFLFSKPWWYFNFKVFTHKGAPPAARHLTTPGGNSSTLRPFGQNSAQEDATQSDNGAMRAQCRCTFRHKRTQTIYTPKRGDAQQGKTVSDDAQTRT